MLLSLTTTQDHRSHRLADQKRPNVGAYLPYKGYNCYQTNYCAEPADKQGNAYCLGTSHHGNCEAELTRDQKRAVVDIEANSPRRQDGQCRGDRAKTDQYRSGQSS